MPSSFTPSLRFNRQIRLFSLFGLVLRRDGHANDHWAQIFEPFWRFFSPLYKRASSVRPTAFVRRSITHELNFWLFLGWARVKEQKSTRNKPIPIGRAYATLQVTQGRQKPRTHLLSEHCRTYLDSWRLSKRAEVVLLAFFLLFSSFSLNLRRVVLLDGYAPNDRKGGLNRLVNYWAWKILFPIACRLVANNKALNLFFMILMVPSVLHFSSR